MTILLLRGYNNYFNRIKKSESSISDYKTASTSYLEYANVNFDYQDGILTSIVVGNAQQLEQSDYILERDKKINSLLTCDLTIPMQDKILKYYKDNIYLMKDRSQCLCHGDYHVGNMIVNNGKIGIIDFDKYNFEFLYIRIYY